jgi:serine/threonine-protein kinase
VDAFLMQVHPVTCDAFVLFLNALDEAGRGAEADRLAPIGVRRGAAGFALPNDWEPEQPVRRVTFDAARAYAAWLAEQTGRPWRLPREREWEKAARGADERLYPWGNFLDPAWCCIADSHRGRPPHPATIHEFPLDTSPYGVRGLGGNVRDWVIDDRAPRNADVGREHRIVKGGHWLGIAQFARSALRYRLPIPADDSVGFRLVASVT